MNTAINTIKQMDKLYNNQTKHTSFKLAYSFEDRIKDTTQIKYKYPDRIPIICEKQQKNTYLQTLAKKKYLVPMDLTIAQFIYVIRKNINIDQNTAIFLCIGNIIPPSNAMFGFLYDTYKDIDGFLYITYTTENTFG